MKEKIQDKERYFSIELGAKANLRNLNLTNGSNDSALVEGTIGKLLEAGFAEGEILEIVGDKGTLRINLQPTELNLASKSQAPAEQVTVQEKTLER